MKANTPRFNMTYSRHEAPVLIPIEYELMKQLGIDRSALHKTAIKEFYNRRQRSTLNLIWGRYGKDNQNLRRSLPDACWRWKALADETGWPGGGTGSGDVLKQEQEEMKGALKRFREQQQQTIKRSYTNAVSIYKQRWQQTVATWSKCNNEFFLEKSICNFV